MQLEAADGKPRPISLKWILTFDRKGGGTFGKSDVSALCRPTSPGSPAHLRAVKVP